MTMVIFLKEWITFDELKSVLDKNLITSVRNKPDSEQLTEVIDSFEIVIYRYFILEKDILSGNEQINMK